jgi:hypothetical protein
MKEATRRLIAGLVIVAFLMALSVGAVASTSTSASTARCGKGYASPDATEEPHARSWHGLALASMLDVILPPLTEHVAAAGEPKDRVSIRGSGLAKAERGLLAGVLSAAVSAGLAAIGSSLDPPPEVTEEATSTDAEPRVGPAAASPDACPEGEGSI